MPAFGLRNLHDPKYDLYEKLEVDEKSLPPKLPAILDYSESGDFPQIDDQSALGSCTCHAARKQFEFYRTKRKKNRALISARDLYASSKAKFHPGDNLDDGLNCSDPLNILMEYYVNESDWSSLPNNSSSDFPSYLQMAPENLHKTDFLVKKIVTVNNDILSIKKGLYAHGIMMLGISWPFEWMNPDSTGVLQLPQNIAGGHALSLVGYNDTIACFDGTFGALKIANNWTASWANKGYCYLPYSYATINNGQFWPSDLFTIVI